jgi:hypothetical protein
MEFVDEIPGSVVHLPLQRESYLLEDIEVLKTSAIWMEPLLIFHVFDIGGSMLVINVQNAVWGYPSHLSPLC